MEHPAAQPSHIDDAWGSYASRDAQPDDAWTATLANRAGPSEHLAAIAPTATPVATPSTLVNDVPTGTKPLAREVPA